MKGLGKKSINLNGRRLEFESEIMETHNLKDRFLVRINSYDLDENDADRGRNVFAYDKNGNFLWRIQDSGLKVLGSSDQEAPCGFTGLGFSPDGKFKVFHFCGFEYTLDLDTGELSDEEFVK